MNASTSPTSPPRPSDHWSAVADALVVDDRSLEFMPPLIDDAPPVHPYAPGSRGPAIASTLVADHGGRQGPWIIEPPKETAP